MKRSLTIIVVAIGLLIVMGGAQVLAAPATSNPLYTYPTFVIKAVDRDTLVTIMTDNLPPNDTFIVTMGAYGTAGINGIQVGTTASGAGGQLTLTYNIPAQLHGLYRIAIRLYSPTSGYYAYNWFYNTDANLGLTTTPEPSPATPTITTYYGYPTISIASVVKGTTVTITPLNFPPNDVFEVRMNWMWTRGIAGAIVETVSTDEHGALSNTTFAIPNFLQNTYRIAIRLQSPTSGYYAYNWFYNNDAP